MQDKPEVKKIQTRLNIAKPVMRTKGNIIKIDLKEAVMLRFVERWSFQQIANRFNVSRNAVSKRLSNFTRMVKDMDSVDLYEEHKAKFLSGVEMKLLESIANRKKIKAADLAKLATTFKEVSNANRLARGQSTENVAISLEERLKQLEKI